MRFLITAGGTREYIDPVRFISNASSGKMGYALALAALKAGHRVTLITTVKNSKLKTRNSKLQIVGVDSAAEMFAAVKKIFAQCDCLIMAAAVSDYAPLRPARVKVKRSNKVITLKLKPTPDILKWAGANKNSKLKTQNSKFHHRIVVGFALEDRNLRANAERKMRGKNLDMIVANTPAAIGSEQAEVFVKAAGKKWLRIARAPKRLIARQLISLIQSLIPKSSLVRSDSNL